MNELMEHDDFSCDISSEEHEHESKSKEHFISIVSLYLSGTCKVLRDTLLIFSKSLKKFLKLFLKNVLTKIQFGYIMIIELRK